MKSRRGRSQRTLHLNLLAETNTGNRQDHRAHGHAANKAMATTPTAIERAGTVRSHQPRGQEAQETMAAIFSPTMTERVGDSQDHRPRDRAAQRVTNTTPTVAAAALGRRRRTTNSTPMPPRELSSDRHRLPGMSIPTSSAASTATGRLSLPQTYTPAENSASAMIVLTT